MTGQPPPDPSGPPGPPGPHDQQPRQPYQQPHLQRWQQPQWQPPGPPRKKRRTGLIILGIIGGCMLLFASCIAILANVDTGSSGGGGATPSARQQPATATEPPARTEPAAATAKLGQKARDGQFEFTVRKVDCTKRRIGGEFGEAAQGVFCLVSMRVANIGGEARTFDDANQYAYDAKGRRFETDGVAAIHLEESNSFLTDINPGNAVDGILVFDVPRGTRLTRVELHDSAFSGGVEVRLTK